MTVQQSRAGNQLNKAIRKLVMGLEKQHHINIEKRKYSRYPFNAGVQLCSKAESGEYQDVCEAWACDMSVGGIRFIIEQEMPRENLLFVNVERLICHPCYIPIRIRLCFALLSHTYQVHSEFVYDQDKDSGLAADAA